MSSQQCRLSYHYYNNQWLSSSEVVQKCEQVFSFMLLWTIDHVGCVAASLSNEYIIYIIAVRYDNMIQIIIRCSSHEQIPCMIIGQPIILTTILIEMVDSPLNRRVVAINIFVGRIISIDTYDVMVHQ